MKKGISPIVATLIFIAVLIVAFMLLSSFISRGASGVQSLLYKKGVSEVGEIPCYRGPVPDAGEPQIVAPEESPPTEVNVTFNATKTYSACLEPLVFSWNFGDGGICTTNETCCIDEEKTCSLATHIYDVPSTANLGKMYTVLLTVEGLRSGYFSQVTTDVTIADPKLDIDVFKPDLSHFPCVYVEVLVKSATKPRGVTDLDLADFDLLDNRRTQEIQVKELAQKGKYKIAYRLIDPLRPKGIPRLNENHTIDVTVTPTYQPTSDSVTYIPISWGTLTDEIIAIRKPGAIPVYDYNGNQIAEIDTRNKEWKSVFAADFDKDLTIEMAGLRTPGDLEIYNMYSLKEDPEKWHKGLKDKPWKDLTAADFDGDGMIEMAAIRNRGHIDIYDYYGTHKWDVDIKDKDSWKGITAADFDGDGEIEMACLRAPGDIEFYNKDSEKNTPEETLDISPDESGDTVWKDITAGDFDGDGVIEMAGLRSPGAIEIYNYNSARHTPEQTIDIPNENSKKWIDIAAADVICEL